MLARHRQSHEARRVLRHLPYAAGLISVIICLSSCAKAEPESAREFSELALRSPVLAEGARLPRIPLLYRCLDESIWLPIEWSEVPPATGEVVLVISVDELKKHGEAVESSGETEWIVGGLPPRSNSLRRGPVPNGAFISGHYASKPNCPSRREEHGIVFSVYAMPEGRHLVDTDPVDYPVVKDLAARALASGSLSTLYGGG